MPAMRPGGPYAVQWSHPLAAGLRDAVIFDTPQGRQLVPFGARPILVGNPSARATAAGNGIKVSSGTSYAYWQPDYTLYNSDWTVSFLVSLVSIPGAYTSLLELGNSGGVRVFALFLDTSGNINFTTFEGDQWGNPGATLGLVVGATNRVTVVVRGSTLSLYKDATLVGTTSIGFRNSYSVPWYVGKNISGGGVEPDAVYGDLFVWPSRGLTAGEVAAFAQNPWPLVTLPRLAHPALSAVDAGGAGPITGSGAVTLGALTSSAAGTLAITGTAAGTLGAATATGTGALAITGASANTLAALTGAAAGTLAITGAGAATLGAVSAAGAGALSITGAGASTLGALTLVASSSDTLTGTAAITLGALTASAVGVLPITATGSVTLGAATAAGVGTLAIAGIGGGTLGAVSLGQLAGNGDAVLPISGALAVTLGALTVVATDAARSPTPASRRYTLPAAPRRATVPAAPRAYTLPAAARRYTVQPEG